MVTPSHGARPHPRRVPGGGKQVLYKTLQVLYYRSPSNKASRGGGWAGWRARALGQKVKSPIALQPEVGQWLRHLEGGECMIIHVSLNRAARCVQRQLVARPHTWIMARGCIINLIMMSGCGCVCLIRCFFHIVGWWLGLRGLIIIISEKEQSEKEWLMRGWVKEVLALFNIVGINE